MRMCARPNRVLLCRLINRRQPAQFDCIKIGRAAVKKFFVGCASYSTFGASKVFDTCANANTCVWHLQRPAKSFTLTSVLLRWRRHCRCAARSSALCGHLRGARYHSVAVCSVCMLLMQAWILRPNKDILPLLQFCLVFARTKHRVQVLTNVRRVTLFV